MSIIEMHSLSEKSNTLAQFVVSLHFIHDTKFLQLDATGGKQKCNDECLFHINYLIEAINMNHPDIYINYIRWSLPMLKSRNISETLIHTNLDFVQRAFKEIVGGELSNLAESYIVLAKEKLGVNPQRRETYITNNNPFKKEVNIYLRFLLEGKRHEAIFFIHELIRRNVRIKDIYLHIFKVSQYEVGRLWLYNKITIVQEYYCTASTQSIISGLYQYIFASKRTGKTMVACTVSGELHEMGIRMVADFFEMEGWNTKYIGSNSSDREVQEVLINSKADLLAISCTLSCNVSKIETLIKQIRGDSSLAQLKIVVGGYTFLSNPGLWKKVSADAFLENATDALSWAN
ncbi:cobalamin B12-binding domain-containing protein [Arenibacter algicola]|uniref:cobalamin B12-binding domain-containing protein n=1 Tax=Arenibacter algicola TaxID=616991 RepID=UPI0004DF7DDF|nr:cobalamin-dependent protein [Arenibacter algicola]